MSQKLRAFGYYGGKNSKLNWLLPQLETPHDMYCEPFAGSLAALLNKSRVKYEIINDMAEEVADFWLALREQKDELIQAIMLSPAGELEFKRCVNAPPTDDIVERARRFYVRIGGAYGAMPNSTSHSFPVLFSFLANRRQLHDVAARICDVIVENTDALRLISRVINNVRRPNHHRTILFYCDPPYTFDSRKTKGGEYIHDDFDHDGFLAAITDAPYFCKFAVSGYDNDRYNSALANWHRVELDTQAVSKSSGDVRLRTEVLWRNYDIVAPAQMHLTLAAA